MRRATSSSRTTPTTGWRSSRTTVPPALLPRRRRMSPATACSARLTTSSSIAISVALNSAGDLFVGDYANARVMEYTYNSSTGTFSSSGTEISLPSQGGWLTFDSSGDLFASYGYLGYGGVVEYPYNSFHGYLRQHGHPDSKWLTWLAQKVWRSTRTATCSWPRHHRPRIPARPFGIPFLNSPTTRQRRPGTRSGRLWAK